MGLAIPGLNIGGGQALPKSIFKIPSGSYEFYIGASKVIDISNDGTKTTLLGLTGDYWRIGDAVETSFGLASANDLLVTGKFEVQGATYHTGTINIGSATIYGRTGTQLEINKITDNPVSLNQWGSNTNFLDINKSRGALGVFTAVQTADVMGYLAFRGADGTDWQDCAYLVAKATGTIGNNRVPGLMEFHLLSDAATSVDTTVMSLKAASVTLGDAIDIIVGTTTGTKIGTGATQKIGLWGVNPVVQQATIVDADGTLADITTKFNNLLLKLETNGTLAAA